MDNITIDKRGGDSRKRSYSTGNRPLITTNSLVIGTARPENASANYLAIFNRADGVQNLALEWNEVGLILGKGFRVRDLWERPFGRLLSTSHFCSRMPACCIA